MTDNNCVVCFKNVKVYSVGECDHPVCYECSTRMRVLCRQNECPMCRHEMGMVVFTERIRPFRRLKKDYSLFNEDYHIAFDNDYIQDAFENLLSYVCKKCHHKSFNSFESLTEHMRRTHDLYSCDLCVDNLKIFPKEFRYYSRSDLNKHRRVGDIDDKSHRGHPLCEFCNIRYVDRDELYRHLRKDHLFCHICDSEGIQQFYGMYGMLRDHYKQDHYLCEEGDCIKEEFTSVFPTEIDLKAHKALVHCKNLRNKLAVKQARTLELEFTLAPRSGGDRRNRHPGTNIQEYPDEESTNHPNTNQNSEPDSRNLMVTWDESAFPSLTNNPTMYSAPRVKPVRENKNRLAFNEQNFPSLGSETSIKFNISNQLDPRPSVSVASTNISVQVNRNKNRNNNRAHTAGPSSSSVSLTWVEKAKEKKQQVPLSNKNQPEPGPSKPPTMSRDNFPKLTLSGGTSSSCGGGGGGGGGGENSKKNKKSSLSIHIEENDQRKSAFNEVATRNVASNKSDKADKKNTSSAKQKDKNTSQQSLDGAKSNCILLNANRKKVKMKAEVDAYVSLNNLTAYNAGNKQPLAGSSGSSGSTSLQTNRANNTNRVQKNNVCDTKFKEESDRNKNTEKKKKDKCENQSPKNKENKNDAKTPKQTPKKGDKEKKPTTKDSENLLKESNKIVSKSEDLSKATDDKSNQRKKSELRIGPLHDTMNGDLDECKTAVIFPPPGFEVPITAPPGLSRVSSESYNQQLFNDNPISYNIPDTLPVYQQPDDFVSRNSSLIDKISKSLMKNNEEAINEFKNTSLLYRESYISATSYYLYCMENIENDKFYDVFVDLVVLLPNILKQQELWTVHQSMKNDCNQAVGVEHCPVCLQILKPSDFVSHLTKHTSQTSSLLFSTENQQK